MKRQTFVTSALSVAFLGGNASRVLAQVAAGSPLLPPFANGVDPDNVLVVIQMGGGNDGLNTVVPWSDDAYHRVRPAIHVTDTQVLKLNERIGFNPALKGLAAQWHNQKLAIVRGVGYPNQDRSHFRSMDIWQTASPSAPASLAFAASAIRQTITLLWRWRAPVSCCARWHRSPGASAGEAPAPAPAAGEAPGQPAARPYAPPPAAAAGPARTAPSAAPVNALSLFFAVIWSRIKALFGRR